MNIPRSPLSLERLSDDIQELTQATESISKSESPSTNTDCVDEEIDQSPVRDAESKKDAKVCRLESI